MARYNRTAPTVYNTDEVFAAACAANRVNGGYLKFPKTDEEGNVTSLANKTLIVQFLDGKLDIRDEDRELGTKVRTYMKGLTFKILQEKISDFERSALDIAESEEISGNYSLAIASSLPTMYIRAEKRKEVTTRIAAANGEVPHTDGKVDLNIDVVKCFFSDNWGKWYVHGMTSDNNLLMFAYVEKVEVGTPMHITGKFKQYNETEKMNKLTHVRVQ